MTEELTTAPDVQKAADLAAAATTQEAFDFAAAVLDRSYPETDVPVFLDEKRVQRMLELNKDRAQLELDIAGSSNPSVEQAKQLEVIDNAYQEVVDELKSKMYLIRIKGISPETSIELEEKALEQFPKTFEDTVAPVTGAPVHTEVESPERAELFAALLRQAHIVSVTAPNGAVDSDFSSLDKVRTTWSRLPYVARVKVDQAINEATIAVDYYRELVDEVF